MISRSLPLSFALVCFLFTFGLSAQGTYNLVIFSEDGMPFTAYVNAVPQNETPSANILITELRSPNAIVEVKFADNAAPDLKQNVYFETANTEVTLRIKETKKGLRLRYFGSVPIAQSTAQPVERVVYTEVPVILIPQTEVTSTTVITETNTEMNGSGENVDIDINIGGVNMSMDVSIDDDMDGDYSSTTTTTTTTTTTGGGGDVIIYEEAGAYDCPAVNMSSLKAAISNEDFADNQMQVARQALQHSCIYVEQLKELAPLFNFEEDRLEFVKYAYDRTYDIESFFEMNSVFTYASTKDELNDFLEGK